METLFNPPLWMPAAAVLIAIGVFIYGNARVMSSVRNIGLGLVAVCVVWCVAAYLVQTRVEKCIKRTHDIVAAVEAGDFKKLGGLLDKATVIDLQTRSIAGREAIVGSTEIAATGYGLKSIRVYGTEANVGPNSVDVAFNSVLEGSQPLTATFRFEYEDRSDGMLLAKIVPVKIGNMSMDQVNRAVH